MTRERELVVRDRLVKRPAAMLLQLVDRTDGRRSEGQEGKSKETLVIETEETDNIGVKSK